MTSLSRILLLVERGDPVHQSLNKALMLARHCHARLELFLCDSRPVSGIRPSGAVNSAHEAEGLEYVQALHNSVASTDIDITVEVSCGRARHLALAQRLRSTRAELVLMAAHSTYPFSPGHTHVDWALIADCGVPVMLTAGRVWRPVPRFAAVLDPRRPGRKPIGCPVVDLSVALAEHCDAELNLLETNVLPKWQPTGVRRSRREAASQSVRGHAARGFRSLTDEPREALSRRLAREDYDLVVIGELPHGAWTGPHAGLVRTLVQASAGDVVVVPSLRTGARQKEATVQATP